MEIDVKELGFAEVNRKIREAGSECRVKGCIGQRFIAAGMNGKSIVIEGIPGNALGAYLDGAVIDVHGNAQDAVGDTMNDGVITVRGNIGDAAGYAMRGGKIYVRGNAGYRAGIHMKAYKEKVPVIVIGGHTGSFLGEYQAGGIIAVLGLGDGDDPIVGNFPCTGMHGGKMYLRGECKGIEFPKQVKTETVCGKDDEKLCEIISDYCKVFETDAEEILSSVFTVVTPDSKNPFKQMYVAN